MKSYLSNKKIKICAISNKYDFLIKDLLSRNIDVITISNNCDVSYPVASHADMMMLPLLNNDIIVYYKYDEIITRLKSVGKNVIVHDTALKDKYPYDVALNCFIINNHLVCNEKYTSEILISYCKKNKINILNVNQGYAKCSTIILNDNAAITSDISIYNALQSIIKDILFVDNKNIILEGYTNGFIGGTCGKINENILYFTGNIKKLTDYLKIKQFLAKQNIDYICYDNVDLIDVGSIILI